MSPSIWMNSPRRRGGRNLDIYLADVARVEVLAGPQGTLYGASSQAGTIRIITNKPNLDTLEFGFEASVSNTRHGTGSNSAEAVLNVPLIDGTLAVRAAIFNDDGGGYIDNVAGVLVPDESLNPRLPPSSGVVFVPAGGDPTAHEFADGTFAEPGRAYPVQHTPADNDWLVEEDFNDVSYKGYRVGALLAASDDWRLTTQHHQQTLDADGVFDFDPEVGDLEVVRYSRDFLADTFGQTSWTLEGRLGQLDAIYAGAYLDRDIDQVYDYSEYVNVGGYIPGYLCEYNTPGYHGGGGCRLRLRSHPVGRSRRHRMRGSVGLRRHPKQGYALDPRVAHVRRHRSLVADRRLLLPGHAGRTCR